MRLAARASLVLLAALGGWPAAGADAAGVLVVLNRQSPISARIAEYYVRARKIPSSNLCAIDTKPVELIDRQTYESDVEAPIRRCIQSASQGYWAVVTTKGVPLGVNGSSGQMAEAAAVDSELTLLPQKIQGEDLPVAGRITNPFFGKYREEFSAEKYPILLVTRLTGYDFNDVRAIINRSLEAKNRGRFVFDTMGETRPGETWMRSAALRLPQNRVKVDRSSDVLLGEENVIAYASWGSNDPNRRKTKLRDLGFEFLPGAIVTTYVSTNGRTFERPPDSWTIGEWANEEDWYKGAPQSLTADSIHFGATGASGHVYEPYLGGTPRPEYVFPAYYSGRNLAESFYLGISSLSWMNIVVGDPLCSLGPPN